MMDFSKAYNRHEFVSFLQNNFLPEDFVPTVEPVAFKTKMTYTKEAVKLGSSESLDLVVYEVKHNSKNDARVSLSKEAFRLLADEMEDRALVIFVPETGNDNYRFSFIELTLEVKDGSSHVTRNYSNPRRYSYFLGEGIAYYTPNKYLNEKGRVVNPEDLQSRFSVEVLTKEFYNELSDWYAWAIKIIRFPNDINNKEDDAKFNNEGAIRLITRLIFVWFLKQRHLIPDEFFDEKYIADNLLNDFSPNDKSGLFDFKSHESKYYKAILQNLFFAMLNSPITAEGSKELSERHFRNGRSDYDNNKLMRYESFFKNPQLFVDLANRTVPFLNGGLFDCLDDKDHGMYYDGFSDKENIKNSLIIPDYLFFGEEAGKNIDLSEWYGDKKKKKVSARGIIDILKRYNFTVEENTPFDKEVSLDPELLGKVFENLLASFNPETQTTARKQTGSFYTPREIVQYMVDESLVAHLKRTVGEELEPQYRQLMQYSDDEVELTSEQRKSIMQSLYNCKILDPACGSGAFPMGILQQMVHILSRIDSGNKVWREMMMQKAVDETSEAYRNSSAEERKELVMDIERSFDESINRPDYARKLYLIENCIYGVDIQPIAIQISKLRFFISLVVDQNTNTDPTDNFGIRPLPNLEAKFVAANTLIGLNEKDSSLFDNEDIKAKENELKIAKHKIFGAKTVRTKRKYRLVVSDLRMEIAEMLEGCGAVGNDEARLLSSWDMFDQNTSSPFFDSEWMFGVKDGFDIVIGNPPYGVSIKGDYRKTVVSELGNVPDYEIYYYFIECAKLLCKEDGILSYIIPNTWLFNTYAAKYRMNLFTSWTLIEILDCTKFPIFDSATVLNSIIIWRYHEDITGNIGYRNTHYAKSFRELIATPRALIHKDDILKMNQNWGLAFFLEEKVKSIIDKISDNQDHICDYFDCSQGYIPYRLSDLIKTYGSDVGQKIKKERLWHSKKKTPEFFIQEIYGKDITKYTYNATGDYVKYGKHVACYVNLDFFTRPRLLVREITNPTIIACYVDAPFINDPQLLPIITKENNNIFTLNLLWGILNSKLATFFHFNHSPKATKGAFPKILVQDIKDFPLPVIGVGDKVKIESIVQQLMRDKDENMSMLDLYIYQLYGLTYDDVLIIDPQIMITREEYEKGGNL